jgi:cytochrome P450
VTLQTPAPAIPDVDLTDPRFWQLPAAARDAAFARLRALDAPVFFTERPASGRRPARGFHALVRHADVVAASRNPRVFLSGPGVTTPEPRRWVRLVFGDSMVNMDDPRHAQLRRIVSRAFSPRLLARTEDDIRAEAARIVDEVIDRQPADFVAAVASPMPFRVICTMMGIPERYRAQILRQVDSATQDIGVGRGLRGRMRLPGSSLRALVRLHLLMARLAHERRRRPADDLISALVTADVDGARLTARELGAFFSLLMVAGVETTRNALAHGMWLLTAHPEQREALWSDPGKYLDTAVEEMIRHASPIIQFRRTLARDHEIGGRTLPRGDKVVLYFCSANRDEAVFDDPLAFDVARDPNPHLGFGGGGPHFCLGAHLARQEMRAVFHELLTRVPGVRATAPPELIPSSFDNRVRSLPFRL